jgi:RNA polymerase sigma-70 factor (ECF subfamily)
MLGTEIPDHLLLASVEADPEAFGTFYIRHEKHVLRYFLRRGATAELAADLTAEVFAAALAAADRFQPDAPAEAWLYGIARRILAASWRRGQVEARARRRLGMRPVELTDESLDRVLALEADESVEWSLDGLSELERAAVEARVLEERDYGDIARELRCSEAVVRQRVSRGLARLRRQLGGRER